MSPSESILPWKSSNSDENRNGYVLLRTSSATIAASPVTKGSNSNKATRCCLHLLKGVNVRRCVAGLVLITVVTILYYTHYVVSAPFVR